MHGATYKGVYFIFSTFIRNFHFVPLPVFSTYGWPTLINKYNLHKHKVHYSFYWLCPHDAE